MAEDYKRPANVFFKDDDPPWDQCPTMEEFLEKNPNASGADILAQFAGKRIPKGDLAVTLSKQDIEILSRPFDDATIGVKVQSFSKDRTRAMLVLYLQHTDVYSRLEEVDPAWTMKVTERIQLADTAYVTVALTMKGVTRENTGEGSEPKGALSDAIKRAAMLFGVGRYLYDSDQVWVKYDETADRYRTWTLADYEQHRRPSPAKPASAPKPSVVPKSDKPSRDDLNRKIMALYKPYLQKNPEHQFPLILRERYAVNETRLLSVEQLADFAVFMEKGIQG